MKAANKANHSSWPSSKWPWLGIFVVAVALRVWGIYVQSISMDEWFEINLAHHSVQRILHEGDGFPPFYNVTLHNITKLFGDGGARWFSVVLSLLSIPVVASMGRQLGGKEAGFWAAALIAIMPLNIWHAQESRAYSLMLFASALCLLFMTRLVDDVNNRRDWFCFAASVTLGIYSHYFFVFLPIALGCIILWRHGLRGLLPLCVTAAGVIVASMPMLIYLRSDLEMQMAWPDKSNFGIASLGYTYFSYLSGYTLGPSTRELHELPVSDALMSVLPWLAVGTLACLLLFAGTAKPLARTKYLLVILVAPIAVGLVGHLTQVGYHGRYVSWGHLALAACFGLWMAERARPKLSWLGLGILLLLFVTAITNRQLDDRYRNADIRDVAHWLAESPPQPIVVVSGYMAPVLRYYLADEWDAEVTGALECYSSADWNIWRVHNAVPYGDRPSAFRELLQRFPAGTNIWFLYTRSFHEDANGELFSILERSGQLKSVHQFAGAKLYVCTIGAAGQI
jgi:4-amino-4-deoxy-L-arabinose transferase-like glycosyltransferase